MRRINEERMDNERGKEEEKNDQKGENRGGNRHREKREKEKEWKTRWDLGKGKRDKDRGSIRSLRGVGGGLEIQLGLFCFVF